MMKKIKYLIPIFIVAILLSSTHIRRYIFWNFADVNDYKRFPSNPVRKETNSFSFIRASHEHAPDLPSEYQESSTESLNDFLLEYETVAFLVIRKDTILVENYYDGYSRESIIPVFSVAKSVVSALAGIALDEGLIKSLDQPITDYLSGFIHDGFEKITIRDLLEMRSGIRFSEDYFNHFGDMARYYYGTHLDRYVYHARIRQAPGEQYDYVSVNTQIMGMIIEKATGKSLSEYLEEKIWMRIGMEYDATWSVDSRENGRIKAFCCLNGRPIDLAKFARLYLHEGNWEGDQVISRDWIRESISITNDSRDSQGYPYHYFWRVLEDGSYFAKGILGQYIYIDPSKDLIIIRLGNKSGDLDWIKMFRKIALEL